MSNSTTRIFAGVGSCWKEKLFRLVIKRWEFEDEERGLMRTKYGLSPGEWQQVGEGEPYPCLLDMDEQQATKLMNSLWDAGIRPARDLTETIGAMRGKSVVLWNENNEEIHRLRAELLAANTIDESNEILEKLWAL